MGKNTNFKATFFEECNNTYMKLEFECHDGLVKKKITIPKIDMNLVKIDRERVDFDLPLFITPTYNDEISFAIKSVNGALFTIQDIYKEMTMYDIEKALGYKVKIVNKN